MKITDILSRVDHTLLSTTATWEEIRQICDDGVKYKTASVCIPPCFVKKAAEYLCGRCRVCTVIGFPNGYSTKEAKCFEAKDAVENGADEIDMVINVGLVKAKLFDELEAEISAVRAACKGKILKVIIETCLLSDEEKVKMCNIVAACGADYIKTSTGFSTGGATREDIALFAANVPKSLKIKAAGGIRSIADAEAFIELGADRLGTSAIVKIVKKEEIGEY